MKKLLMATTVLCSLFTTVCGQQAGYRKLRPDEISYLNAIHAAMFNAIPHTYRNWKVVADKEQFDARRFWCGIEVDGQDCLGDCPMQLGKVEPYTLSYDAEYTMANNESGAIAATSMAMIKDFTDAKQLAAAQKYAAQSKVKIRVVINSPGIDFSFSYCAKTPLEIMQLPVPAALAVIGMRSVDCQITDDGRPSMHADYYDRALIVLGLPVAKKAPENTSDGLTTAHYVPGFEKSKISKLVAQNISVEIKGDANDIRAMVQQINWKTLSDLLAK